MFLHKKYSLSGVVVACVSALMLAGCGGDTAADLAAMPLDQHVTTRSGELTGNPADTAGIVSFKGIPYAAAPVGALRWKAPQPVASWTTPRDATQAGAKCWASTASGGPIVTVNKSEDCLSLNV